MNTLILSAERCWWMIIPALVGLARTIAWLVSEFHENQNLLTSEPSPLELPAETARSLVASEGEHFVDPFTSEAVPLAGPPADRAPAIPADAPPPVSLAAVDSVDVVPHVRRGDSMHRMYVAPVLFEKHDAGASDAEFMLAKAELESRPMPPVDDSANRWFEAGLQDSEEFLNRDEVEFSEPGTAPGNGQPPRSHGLCTALRTEDLGTGVIRTGWRLRDASSSLLKLDESTDSPALQRLDLTPLARHRRWSTLPQTASALGISPIPLQPAG